MDWNVIATFACFSLAACFSAIWTVSGIRQTTAVLGERLDHLAKAIDQHSLIAEAVSDRINDMTSRADRQDVQLSYVSEKLAEISGRMGTIERERK